MMYYMLCSYFETYGCIPELNDNHDEEKFRAMRKSVTSVQYTKVTILYVTSTGHYITVTVFYREC